jgi:hypothetical protein
LQFPANCAASLAAPQGKFAAAAKTGYLRMIGLWFDIERQLSQLFLQLGYHPARITSIAAAEILSQAQGLPLHCQKFQSDFV